MWCLIGINVVIGWSLVSGCLCQILVEMKLCIGDEAQQLVVLRVVFIGFVDFDVLFISFVAFKCGCRYFDCFLCCCHWC